MSWFLRKEGSGESFYRARHRRMKTNEIIMRLAKRKAERLDGSKGVKLCRELRKVEKCPNAEERGREIEEVRDTSRITIKSKTSAK